ncbi:mitochondrial amidoxime-reducing component 1-like isoform X2 [Bacillus rossius redtenbacheri]|uniref:mitochondrial amidoxime-reducing component 1-like isoform X2 n=1 Tax=Bacillus rossius redtenbacheri TaxID=93214 RepID=UPI002FDCC819
MPWKKSNLNNASTREARRKRIKRAHQLYVSMSGRLAALALAACAVAACGAAWWRRSKKRPPAGWRWRRVGELAELYVYPLKSGGAIALREAECTQLGVTTSAAVRDRMFLVFNETNGEFKTARQMPHMVLIKFRAEDDHTFVFEAPDMEPLTVRISDDMISKKRTCTMWFDEKVSAVDCGDEAAAWVSRYALKKDSGLRLGHHLAPHLARRRASVPPWSRYQKAFGRLGDEDMGAFADITSYMLMTESSVAAVGDRLPGRRVTTLQFRPNLVVRGPRAFEEDSWSWVRIGEHVVLKTAAPCTRCILTCVDPETGIMDPQREPLKTLKTFRQMTGRKEREVLGDAPLLGVYMGLYSPGKVSVGDPVYVA